jgi:hypothetical protein
MAMTKVEYREVVGAIGYRVGDDGSLWSCRTKQGLLGSEWKQIVGGKLSKGGHRIAIIYPGRRRALIHRLVLEAFVGPCPPGMESCHNDGNPVNNVASNLRWDTHKSNFQDMRRHGHDDRGSRNVMAKLTEEKVKAARQDYAGGGFTFSQLADKYGVSETAMYLAVSRKSWAHVA